MAMKPMHLLCLGLAALGAVYLYHMLSAHQGASILPTPSH